MNLFATSNKNNIEPKDLGERFGPVFDDLEISEYTLESFEIRQLREKLKFIEAVLRTSESQRHAAKRLGISESTLRGQLERAKA